MNRKSEIMNRKPLPVLWMVLLALLQLTVSAEVQRPNFVFMFADDFGYGDLACYGHPYVKSPNIDRMASQGTRFNQAYAAGRACNPSRTGLMTAWSNARFPKRTDDFDFQGRETVTSILKKNGYATGHFGKWHIGIDRSHGVYGIDENDSGGRPDKFSPNGRDTPIYEKAIDFIRRHKDGPFYVNIWGFTSHAPVASASNYLEKFKDVKLNRNDFSEFMQPVFDDSVAVFDDLDLNMRHYLANVYALDLNVKMVMDVLNELGIADNTVLVFSSDQGPPRPLGHCLGELDRDLFAPKLWNIKEKRVLAAKKRAIEDVLKDVPQNRKKHFQNLLGNTGTFRGSKGSSLEGGLRVPFIVRWPGKVKSNFVDTQNVIGLIDWLPTICSLAGVKNIPNDLDGEDVSDMWLGLTRKRTKPLLWGPREPGLTIREDQWKYYLLFDERNQYYGEALYDVVNDPGEKSNLVESYPEIASKLKAKLMEFYEELPKKIIKTGNYKHQY
jgi:N-acetylgalactosamine-6-sulfatase